MSEYVTLPDCEEYECPNEQYDDFWCENEDELEIPQEFLNVVLQIITAKIECGIIDFESHLDIEKIEVNKNTDDSYTVGVDTDSSDSFMFTFTNDHKIKKVEVSTDGDFPENLIEYKTPNENHGEVVVETMQKYLYKKF